MGDGWISEAFRGSHPEDTGSKALTASVPDQADCGQLQCSEPPRAPTRPPPGHQNPLSRSVRDG